MAKAKREKKPDPPKAPELRLLPMQLHIGDRFTDSRGEWRATGRPFTTAAGENAHARAELVKQPTVTEIHFWGAHERVAVRQG